VSEVLVISATSPDLILRSIAQAMSLEGWPRATAVQAAILRDTSLRPPGKGLFLRMRIESVETIGFMESLV
jgi:hypothetical protein